METGGVLEELHPIEMSLMSQLEMETPSNAPPVRGRFFPSILFSSLFILRLLLLLLVPLLGMLVHVHVD